MDLIGHDVNFAVTCSVFNAFFGDPRFTPSLRQKELVDAGHLGRKSGRGFYNYGPDAPAASPATCGPARAPDTIRLFGNDPLTRVLHDRLSPSHRNLQHLPATDDGRLAQSSGFTLYRTDGRTATQRAASLGEPNLVLVDLAFNYSTAKRLAITCADQAAPSALTEAAGLLQAAGYAVSPTDDAPGLIVMRTVASLANEAADAVHQGVCSVDDCDLAMRLGVNYPRGPLAWADDLGSAHLVKVLDNLASFYGDPRYRVSPLLRRNAITGATFHAFNNPQEQQR
jgi:3-hydroxybutyryl-CoA dehydrogenase